MKLIFTRIVSLLLLTVLYQAATAQTYNITTSVSSSIMGATGFSTCTGCVFNISPGITFTINTGGTCIGCIFNGGTLDLSSSSTVAWDGVTTINNETLQINTATTFQGLALTNDSLQVNSNMTLGTNASTISGSHIEVNNATITATKNVTATNSFFALNNTPTFTSEYFLNGGTLTLSGSTMYVTANSYIYANSQLIMQSGSNIYVGDGTTASAAYLYYNTSTALDIVDNSSIKVMNPTNYYFNWHNYNYYVTSTTGTATAYAGLATPYTYGCATLNKNGAGSCAVLAVSEIDLTVVATGDNAAALTWADPQSSTAGSYEVQRSTDNSTWATIVTIDAAANTAGYHYKDASAPTGMDDYRIVRIDQHGDPSYSIISSVTIATAATADIRLYPNPATGHTFFITTPNTEQLTVNIYTVTGQLLSHQSLQGQLQYRLLLPSQLLPGNAVIVQAITTTGKQAFPLLLQ